MARARIGCLLLLIAALAGCGGSKLKEPARDAPPGIVLTSPAFYACGGGDTSPPLAWADVPDGTKSLALLMEDPDAPSGTFVHWTVFDIPPTTRRFPQGKAPPDTQQGENSFGKTGYGGPCPPKGDQAHRYVFALYALRTPLGLENGAKPDAVHDAISKHAIARGRLIGTFKRG